MIESARVDGESMWRCTTAKPIAPRNLAAAGTLAVEACVVLCAEVGESGDYRGLGTFSIQVFPAAATFRLMHYRTHDSPPT